MQSIIATEALNKVVSEMENDFYRESQNPEKFGLAKRITTAMEAESVDIEDQDAVERWIGDFNQRSTDERDVVIGSPLLPTGPIRFYPAVDLTPLDQLPG